MYTILLALNLLFSVGNIQNADFYLFYDGLTYADQQIIDENNISNFNELEDFFISYLNSHSTNDYDHSDGYVDVKSYFDRYYKEYNWNKYSGKIMSEVSNAVPINVQGDLFPQRIIAQAINNLNLSTSYGGCGPIAMIGIIDYLARYLGFTEFMNDPNSDSDRVLLVEKILNQCPTFEVNTPNGIQTLMLPWSYAPAFNRVMRVYGLSSDIHANVMMKLIPGRQKLYWDTVVNNINEGIPLTLATGVWSGEEDFAEHYTNIVGYETWVGRHQETGERIEKSFIIARINQPGSDNLYYCDAEILNDGMIALVTYNFSYRCSSIINASDFSQEFINNNGDGQYYFYNKTAQVTTSQGEVIQTNRLRASYIENQYLVLSPNRVNAGIAYIDLEFGHCVEKMIFDAALWSNNEGVAGQKFEIQYYDDGEWKTAKTIDLYKMDTKNIGMSTYLVLFPKTTKRIRFIATKQNPLIDRNKGRIVLDRIKVYYN